MSRLDRKQEEARARLVAAVALAFTAALAFGLIMTAPRHPPVGAEAAAPDISATSLQAANLERFISQAGACRIALTQAHIQIEPVADLREGASCGYTQAVALTQSLHPYSGPVTTSCAVAAGLVLWERDVVAPAAARHFGQGVARIELAGPAYACRSIAGRADGRMSEHASANAIDIGGFTLADGRVLTVKQGWRGRPQEQAFWRDVRDGGCDLFQVALSPDYNHAHHDHLHLDMGRYKLCR